MIGTKVQVWNGTADRTPGGLSRADLVKNKRGKIVSRAKHDAAKALHPNGPPTAETRQGGFLQFLAPILGSLLGSILTPSSGSGSGSGSGLGRAHLATASSHLEAAMRAGRVTPEQIRRAAATVMAHRGRGGGPALAPRHQNPAGGHPNHRVYPRVGAHLKASSRPHYSESTSYGNQLRNHRIDERRRPA